MVNPNSSPSLFTSLFHPRTTFQALALSSPSPLRILLLYSLWLILLPPLCSWWGAYLFGWRLGASEPLLFEPPILTLISAAYFLTLFFGLFTTALISRWMASTYGANDALGLHVALITVVGTPLAFASIAHLFPHVFFNVVVLIPTTIWSMYLLYTGIPIVLNIPPERGMLMSTSLVGWLLVGAVSILGLSVGLWTVGIGPSIAV